MNLEGIVLTAAEAAEAAGVHIDTIRSSCRAGDIAASKFGNSRKKGYRITVAALLAWIKKMEGIEEEISLANWLKAHKVPVEQWEELDATLNVA